MGEVNIPGLVSVLFSSIHLQILNFVLFMDYMSGWVSDSALSINFLLKKKN